MQAPRPSSRCLLPLLALLLPTVGGAAVGQDRVADDSIVVNGTVKKVTLYEPTDNLVGEILVEVDFKGKYRFLMRKDTKIHQGNANGALWADLRVGQRVAVTFNGIVIRTSPPQAGADRIVIETPPNGGTPR